MQVNPADNVHCHPAILSFFRERPTRLPLMAATRLVDLIDSLTFLDFFLFLEQMYGDALPLDEVAGCATLGALTRLLDTRTSFAAAGQ